MVEELIRIKESTGFSNKLQGWGSFENNRYFDDQYGYPYSCSQTRCYNDANSDVVDAKLDHRRCKYSITESAESLLPRQRYPCGSDFVANAGGL